MSVFLGWMPGAATQAALAIMQQRIRAALPADAPRHDWRKPAQWHMTLRYLGETVDDVQRTRLEAAMADLAMQAPAADAMLVGAQYWPHARVLVAKIDAADALKALLKRLEAEAQACGFAKERAQTAHITLAYLANRQAPTQSLPPSTPVALHVDRIELLRTVPGAYMSLASWPLSRPSTDA